MIRMDSHRNVLTDRNWSPTLQDVSEPNLFREIYDYDSIPKTAFNFRNTPMDMPEDIWMTDTTFRDGQQSTSPFTVKQIVELYRLMHRLGGKKGMIKQCEFFLYTEKDRKAVEECQQLGYEFPEITRWIRANRKDFALVKAMGIKETGILFGCSAYHIFKNMLLTRRQAADQYLGIVKEALSKGIVPRCHFEDITRADFYGFVVPFAIELMKLSEEAGIPVKIRACDTLGYGISYPGVTLPRSVPGIIAGLKYYAQVPSAQLEWHGHNDFYKVVTNSATAWLYGCSSVNCSLLGIGERTGNCPLEAMVIEYASLRGTTNGMDISVITEIADYFEKEMGYSIPPRTPFVGRNFNTTRAGVHADGLLKDVEIYNIFNTEKLLNRVPLVSVDSHSGLAGIAYWINGYYKLSKDHEIDKKHDIVVKMKEYIDDLYAKGRNTCMGDEEMDEILRHINPKLHKKLIDAATGEDY